MKGVGGGGNVTPMFSTPMGKPAIKNASRFLHVFLAFGASSKTLPKKKCHSLLAKCLVSYDLLLTETYFDQCSPMLQVVSPMYMPLPLHILLQILQDGYELQSFNGKIVFIFSITILQ